MLVAPQYSDSESAFYVRVFLPSGLDWVHLWTNVTYRGVGGREGGGGGGGAGLGLLGGGGGAGLGLLGGGGGRGGCTAMLTCHVVNHSTFHCTNPYAPHSPHLIPRGRQLGAGPRPSWSAVCSVQERIPSWEAVSRECNDHVTHDMHSFVGQPWCPAWRFVWETV